MVEVDEERKRRIRLSIAAYAYEVLHENFMSDSEYDKESSLVDLSKSTGNKILDKFFQENFDPSTGLWIYSHPDLKRIHELTLELLENKEEKEEW